MAAMLQGPVVARLEVTEQKKVVPRVLGVLEVEEVLEVKELPREGNHQERKDRKHMARLGLALDHPDKGLLLLELPMAALERVVQILLADVPTAVKRDSALECMILRNTLHPRKEPSKAAEVLRLEELHRMNLDIPHHLSFRQAVGLGPTQEKALRREG